MEIPLIYLVCCLHVCVGIWVTVGLDKKDMSHIFLTARDKGRSNGEIMLEWSDHAKGEICKEVLNSSSFDVDGLKYFEKSDMSNVEVVFQWNRELFDKHFKHDGEFVDPCYPVEFRDVIVDEESYEVFAFPCLVIDDDNMLKEVYIGDGYLEKTYTLLSPINTAEWNEHDDEEVSLLILGFLEVPPVREPKNEPKILEELYYASLEATQVLTFLNWDEDPQLINQVQKSSAKEKMKLCSLVYEAIRKDLEWEVSSMIFEIEDFKHGPASFTALKIKPPVIEPKHQIIRGVECTGLDERVGKVHFILIPNWLDKDCVFVLQYEDHLPAAPIVYPGDSASSRTQSKSVRPSSKKKSVASSSTTEPKIVLNETSAQRTAVVLLSHVRSVSFLSNKLNGIYVAI